MAESGAATIFGEALDKLGEAAKLAKEAACAKLQEEGLANTRWQPVAPNTTGAIAVPPPSAKDQVKGLINDAVRLFDENKEAFDNPYKNLTNEELSRVLATAFDGKTDDGVSFTEAELGNLRATAAERNIKAVAPDRDCTLKDLGVGR